MPSASGFWDRAAPKYAKSPIKNMAAYEETLGRVRAHLNASDRVLELGCGTGSTALLLADTVEQYTGSDFSQGMIAEAQAKLAAEPLSNLKFTTADAFDPAFAPETYDAVLAFNLFHLVANRSETLSRAKALLKPGGLLMSKTPCLKDFGWYIGPLIAVMQMFGKAPYVGRFSVTEWDSEMEKAGFEIIETGLYPAKPPSRFVVAKKS